MKERARFIKNLYHLVGNLCAEYARLEQEFKKDCIVSLTSIPSRFAGLGNVVENLKNQSIPPSSIEINIPNEYRNRSFEANDLSAIPKDVSVYRVDHDWGPATKIIPTVQRYRSQDLPIIYLDDDRVYRADLIETFLAESHKYPNNAIAAHTVSVERQLREAFWKLHPIRYRCSRIFSAGFWNPKKQADGFKSRIAEGFGGVLIKPSFFDERIFDYPDHLRSVDDVWISGMLALADHDPITISSLQPSSEPNIIDGRDVGQFDALVSSMHNTLDRFQANTACITYLQKKFGIWKQDTI